jgi:hypothetical protein
MKEHTFSTKNITTFMVIEHPIQYKGTMKDLNVRGAVILELLPHNSQLYIHPDANTNA